MQTIEKPRKIPKQSRSVQTVEAILTATAQVLVARGYEGTTTGAVAERAGVSIGTLYQYFPNRESLIETLVRRHVDELLETVDRTLVDAQGQPLPDLLDRLVEGCIAAHSVSPALHKVLVEEVPRRSGLRQYLEVSKPLEARLVTALAAHRPSLPAEQAQMAAFTIETCVEALIHRAVQEAPETLASGALQVEIGKLVRGYLAAAGAGSDAYSHADRPARARSS